MDLKPGAHVHLIGICGTAMASLAGLLKGRGFNVTGSDNNPYPPMSTQIENLGIKLMKGYGAANLAPAPDFVIVGNVISANNPEAEELRRLGIPYTSLAKAIGEWIIADRSCVNISGTHGKTTTTALASWVWDQLGLDPGFLIGGVPHNFPYSFRNPVGSWFVIEGDEYDTAYFDKVPKFTHYKPKHVIFTSCEFDHADIYADFKAVQVAFEKLVSMVPNDGTLMYWSGSPDVKRIAQQSPCPHKISYDLRHADYTATGIRVVDGWVSFEVNHREHVISDFKMRMPGEHNVLNALSVIALAHHLGFGMVKVQEALASFKGVKRRQEVLGEPGGILVIEDFAHHPTAVRETVKAVKALYPGRKFFCVFEPRSATSRRRVFQAEYVEAFSFADETVLMKAFDQSKIQEGDRFSSEELASSLIQRGKAAACFEHVDAIVDYLGRQAKKGDAVLVMSNGGFDGIYGKLLARLA